MALDPRSARANRDRSGHRQRLSQWVGPSTMRLELMRWMVRGAGLALGGAAVLGLVLLAFSAAGVLLLIFLSILSRRASGRS